MEFSKDFLKAKSPCAAGFRWFIRHQHEGRDYQLLLTVPGVGPESPADHDYAGGFAAALMLKDLRLAAEAAGSVHAQSAATMPKNADMVLSVALMAWFFRVAKRMSAAVMSGFRRMNQGMSLFVSILR